MEFLKLLYVKKNLNESKFDLLDFWWRLSDTTLLYIFRVVILGTIACKVGLAVLEPSMIGEPADPFATPLEILPEWYFFPVFQILRTVPNKLLGVLLIVSIPTGLLTVPFSENVNKFQNPFRRPVATTVFLIGTAVDIRSTIKINSSLYLYVILKKYLMR